MGAGVNGTLAGIERRMNKANDVFPRAVNDAALKLQRTMIMHLKNQDLPWKMLGHNEGSAKYLRRKIAEGYSNKTRIRTATSMETIRILPVSSVLKWVGWPRGVMHKDGEEAYKINLLHEYGSADGKTPARPLLEPSKQEVKPWFKKRLQDGIREAFK